MTSGGQVNQGYLWAEENSAGTTQHRGIDFSYGTGTNVYAIADGTVVDLVEDRENGERSSDWGNFVLIKHDQRHYDRTTDQPMAYTYSMYLHLSKYSVQPGEGTHVTAGQLIAQSDDTGQYSTGPHLHLQIVINTSASATLEPFTLDSENKSRNPELWLKPYNSSTARAIGKITDSNGNPLQNLIICGMQKPYGGYTWSRTYSYNFANPDDIYVENFATTDVSPGNYHLYAYQYTDPDDECGTTTLYADLGQYTFEANRTTFIGLHPVYLPDVRINWYGWNSLIYIRNNSSTKTATVNTTLFLSTYVSEQFTNSIPPKGTISIDPGDCYFCRLPAMVISSEDVSVVVESVYDDNGRYLTTAYPGVTRPGTKLYAPLAMKRWPSMNLAWKQTSDIGIQNTVGESNYVEVTLYDSYGTDDHSQTFSFIIQPYGRKTLDLYAALTGYWETFDGSMASAVISATYPIAAIVSTDIGISGSYGQISTPYLAGAYSAFSSGSNIVYLPAAANLYYNYDSGLQVQNLRDGNTTIKLEYYQIGQSLPIKTISGVVIGPYESINFWRPAGLPSGFLGGAVATVTSGGPIVAMGQFERAHTTASLYGTTQYEGVTTSNQLNTIAHFIKANPGSQNLWGNTGIQGQNMNTTATTMRLDYFYLNGISNGSSTSPQVSSKGVYNFFSILPFMEGSAKGYPSWLAWMVSFDTSNVSSWTNKDCMKGYSAVR